MEATAVIDTTRGRAARAAQQALGGLPRPFWVLWTGTLINRLGFFVEPFMALYLSSARHLPRRGPASRRRLAAAA